ncbi:hypothetical protein [Polyangium sorediatum]|uniref:Uncharacterized protein n=1 Tax=Polyangium sorediatum TaxID=889274 RepID=A0ABT6NMC7_9BACT|nr:hypothetical protein [Polyangium sorediatum]MDI1429473.1 hypothetical protein [Polyangium sorediatum]
MPDPCVRYRIQLVGDRMNAALRAKYVAAFGDACYVSEANTFDCWYKTWEKACEDAALIGEVSGNAPYDRGYKCQPDGVGNYWLQIGSDVANRTWIFFDNAPRQTPLVEVDGVPVEVSGPYRDLPEPPTVGPGHKFNNCDSGVLGADGKPLLQHRYILQVNRKAHGGEIHSDLAGFKWTCTVYNANCEEVSAECEEPLVLHDPAADQAPFDPGASAEVNHVVPRKDQRSCDWGTNSNKNAAVISQKLNRYLSNTNPPVEEVKRVNAAKSYTP